MTSIMVKNCNGKGREMGAIPDLYHSAVLIGNQKRDGAKKCHDDILETWGFAHSVRFQLLEAQERNPDMFHELFGKNIIML